MQKVQASKTAVGRARASQDIASSAQLLNRSAPSTRGYELHDVGRRSRALMGSTLS
jgi:hypothetical protein